MKRTNGLFIAAIVILSLTAIYWLIQGFGLMFSGAPAGIYSIYLVLPVIMVVLALISRKRALLGGIITSTLGILLAVYFLMIKLDLYAALPFLFLMSVPMAISGLLLIEADWNSKKMSRT